MSSLTNFPTSTYPTACVSGRGNYILRCSVPECPFFARNYVNYDAHIEHCHFCQTCELYFVNVDSHSCSQRSTNQEGGAISQVRPELDLSVFKEVSRSHIGAIVTYLYTYSNEFVNIEEAIYDVQDPIKKLLTQLIAIHGTMRVTMKIEAELEQLIMKDGAIDHVKTIFFYFPSEHHELTTNEDITLLILECCDEITWKLQIFIENGSNFYVKRIKGLEISAAETRFFQNARIRGYLNMPFRRKGFINFKTTKDCFKVCVCCSLFFEEAVEKNQHLPAGKKKRLTTAKTWREYFPRLNFNGVCAECGELKGIHESLNRFERQNNVTVNVVSHKGNQVFLARRSTTVSTSVVNLFLIHKNFDDCSKHDQYHFVLIKDMGKFYGPKLSVKRRKFICSMCMRYYNSKKNYESHVSQCVRSKSALQPSSSALSSSKQVKPAVTTKCQQDNPTARFPPLDAKLKFSRPELLLFFPYVIYASFLTSANPMESTENETNPEILVKGYTFIVVCNKGFRSGNGQANVVFTERFYEDGALDNFFSRIFTVSKELLSEIRNTNNWKQPTLEELIEYESITHCQFCNVKFTVKKCEPEKDKNRGPNYVPWDFESWEEEDLHPLETGAGVTVPPYVSSTLSDDQPLVYKIMHHDHNFGGVEAICCSKCNLRILSKNYIPVIFHSESTLDFRFIVNGLRTGIFTAKGINVLAKSANEIVQIELSAENLYVPKTRSDFDGKDEMEDEQKGPYKGSRKVRIRIINSHLFVQEPLTAIISSMNPQSAYFELLKETLNGVCSNFSPDIPYEELIACLNSLPSPAVAQSLYGNVFVDGPCARTVAYTSVKALNVLNRVCSLFNINELGTYSEFFTTVKTAFLSCFWEQYRFNAYKHYSIEPSSVPTISGLSFQTFLFYSKCELEFCRDMDMIKWIEDNVKGGICYSASTLTTANNCWNTLNGGYDPKKKRSFLMSFDLVSMYPFVMRTFLFPTDNYNWLTREELDEIKFPEKKPWQEIEIEAEENREYDFILEVDLVYSKDIHSVTRDLPLAFSHVHLQYLSQVIKFGGGIGNCLTNPTFKTGKKLLGTCFNKYNYVAHAKLIRYFTQFGMSVKKVHRGIRFRQTPVFRSYIDFTLEMRKNALTEIEARQLKSMANNLSGRLLYSLKNTNVISFCNSRAESHKLASSARCKGFSSVGPNTSVYTLSPKHFTLNNALLQGFTVLSLSHLVLYSSFYNKIKKAFPQSNLLYIDCDGGYLEIFCESEIKFLEIIAMNSYYFDLSKLEESHLLFKLFGGKIPNLRNKNRGESGKIKIESLNCGQLIALNSKTYSLVTFDRDEKKQCRSIGKDVLQGLTHESYRVALQRREKSKVTYRAPQLVNGSIRLMTKERLALNSENNARQFIADTGKSVPYGYCASISEACSEMCSSL